MAAGVGTGFGRGADGCTWWCHLWGKVFEAAGVPVPQWYQANVAANRFGAGVGVWFVGNMISNQLISTGAFEIYYDGQLVFSKLQEGRMPTAPELLTAMGLPGISPVQEHPPQHKQHRVHH